ncbi:MAG: LCP family protein [Patescibacteria group bacterium]
MSNGIHINFLGGEAEKKSRRSTAIVAVVFAVMVGLLAAIGAGASYRAAVHGTNAFIEVGNLPIISDIRRLVLGSSGSSLQPKVEGQLTILVMGVGGAGHDGPELTDTILIATIDTKTKRVAMVSVPRDLAFPLGSGRFIKINAVNAYAEQSHPGQGARETADAFEELFGIKIDRVVKIDFQAFADLVDALGGVDVNVERSFVDHEYPAANDGYETISFQQGVQHMSGAQALIYARSRHGSNGEGSDFARSHRQQLLMVAIKEKALSIGTLSNPQKLMKLYQAIAANVQTDMTPWDALTLAPLAKDVSSENVNMRVLTDGPKGQLVSSNVSGAYMLFPKKQDWSEIRTIVEHPFDSDAVVAADERAPIRVEIRNGTPIEGLGARIAQKLKTNGYSVQTIGNASVKDVTRTTIYDQTHGNRMTELNALANTLRAATSSLSPATAQPSSGDLPDADFIILLGSDATSVSP